MYTCIHTLHVQICIYIYTYSHACVCFLSICVCIDAFFNFLHVAPMLTRNLHVGSLARTQDSLQKSPDTTSPDYPHQVRPKKWVPFGVFGCVDQWSSDLLLPHRGRDSGRLFGVSGPSDSSKLPEGDSCRFLQSQFSVSGF